MDENTWPKNDIVTACVVVRLERAVRLLERVGLVVCIVKAQPDGYMVQYSWWGVKSRGNAVKRGGILHFDGFVPGW